MAKPLCFCDSCRHRREAQARYLANHPEKREAKRVASLRWKHKERAALKAEPSDEELDRRALQMEARWSSSL